VHGCIWVYQEYANHAGYYSSAEGLPNANLNAIQFHKLAVQKGGIFKFSSGAAEIAEAINKT